MLDPTTNAERKALKAHDLMRQTGSPPDGLVPALIESSWRRCLEKGPCLDGKPEFDPGRKNALDLMRQCNKTLIDHALPIMETLYEQIANTQSMVVLSDAGGYILHSLGDDDFLAKAQRVALSPGVEWSECSRGTNAIGTALAEKAPLVVHGAQHFLPVNHFLTCSASPLRDPYGKIVGVLDVTGDYHRFSHHTLALANMSARMIENHLFCHSFVDTFVVRLHARPEFLGTLCEGLAAFREDGLLLSANQSGWFQFGLPGAVPHNHSFATLFSISLEAALDMSRRAAPAPCPLLLHNGIRVFVRIEAARRRASRPASNTNDRPGTGTLSPPGNARQSENAILSVARQAIPSRTPLLIEYEDAAAGESVSECLRQHIAGNVAWHELDCGNPDVEHLETLLNRLMQRPPADAAQAAEVVFLCNVHKLGHVQQARLVSALQAGSPPHGRGFYRALIASCHGKLKKYVARKAFRGDLYYRLSSQIVSLPGRVPCSEVAGADLDSITRLAIEAALDAAGGNISAAARRLGISRSTLYRRLRDA